MSRYGRGGEPVTRDDVEAWLEAYRRAWRSDDPDQIRALFTEDATYHPSPFGKPWQGREAIVDKWIEAGDSHVAWEFESQVLAVDGEVGVVRGLTSYAAHDGEPEAVYSNIWVIRLAADGRATEFSDWWVERPRPAG